MQALRKTYGEIEALRELTFTVEKGTMYGLIGPDGAGKSTFMRIAACLLFQSGGRVEVKTEGAESRLVYPRPASSGGEN